MDLTEGNQIMLKTFKVDIMSIGLSMIVKTYQGKRKEFAFLYFESIKFIALEEFQRKELQLKIAYV